MNIIFDIDGTLIDADGRLMPRPHLEELFDYVFQTAHTVSIWTAAGREWYDLVHKGYKFRLVFTGERCVIKWRDPFGMDIRQAIKPLRKIWHCKTKYTEFTKHNTIIIDDTPHTYVRNYGNAVPIRSYTNNDNELKN